MKKIISIAFAAVLMLFGAAPAHAQTEPLPTPEDCVESDNTPEGIDCSEVEEGNPDVYPVDPGEGEVPEIQFDLLGPVCVGIFPYIQWQIAGTGIADDATATITISTDEGVVQVLTNQPLSGSTIWPGASVSPPDWPGWEQNDDGIWVEDDSDSILRDDLTVEAEVNPTTIGTISYPEADEACANPENPPVVPAPTVPPTGLPATGSSGANGIMQIGGLLLVGGFVVFAAARRRSPAPTA